MIQIFLIFLIFLTLIINIVNPEEQKICTTNQFFNGQNCVCIFGFFFYFF